MISRDQSKCDKLLSRLVSINDTWFQREACSRINLLRANGKLPVWQSVRRGIYIFLRHDCNSGDSILEQVVRIGTHSIKKGGSKSTLWGRLRQHRGNISNGGGNHRGSIFRLLVGDAIIRRENISDQFSAWGIKRNASRAIRDSELLLEQRVSEYVRQLPFMVLKVDPAIDGPVHRAYLERNLIAILSSVGHKRESDWLGTFSSRQEVRNSGLWNNNHVNEEYDSAFLGLMEDYVVEMARENEKR